MIRGGLLAAAAVLAFAGCSDGGTTPEGGASQAPDASELTSSSTPSPTESETVDIIALCDEVGEAFDKYPSKQSLVTAFKAMYKASEVEGDRDFDRIFFPFIAAVEEGKRTIGSIEFLDASQRIDELLPDVKEDCRVAGSDF